MSVVVVATLYPRPENRADVVAALEDTIAVVHAQDEGCELYALHEGVDRLVIIEKWVSQDALDTHGRGSAVAELGGRLRDKMAAAGDVQVLTPHPAGTPELGTLRQP
jgi:quinol monooxygenase YgiN